MWERVFLRNGELLAHNYMYDGHTYENGASYLPPIKKLIRSEKGLLLQWFSENERAKGDLLAEYSDPFAVENEERGIWSDDALPQIQLADVPLPENAVIEGIFSLGTAGWTMFPKGGLYLAETETSGTAIVFDSCGKTQILSISEEKPPLVEDEISFGSAAPYWMEPEKEYSFRILIRNGLYEIYLNDTYLQTFNNAHSPGSLSTPFSKFGIVSLRGYCTVHSLRIYAMQ